MTLDQLTGRYRRLKEELEQAYAQKPWHQSLIDRIADDISAAEREISVHQAAVDTVPLAA